MSDAEANEGTTVTLKCKIVCTPAPEVKWFKGGTDITKDPRVKVKKNGNVILSDWSNGDILVCAQKISSLSLVFFFQLFYYGLYFDNE